ncbi:alpha/beta fold hydrolase [uncultured Ruegeria sp.]|uniref:alpha/beta fold hydrolase n=1 Tax=uncultured Ruegeria sp. TaxID=259304 RepID=UPI00261DBC30|nr:alpha/beta fold hydrolase [uncultured Ruegeria sp.]
MEYHFAGCTLNDARLTLTRAGAQVAVEPKVFDLIHLLVRHAGDLVTRDRMTEEVWAGRIVSESAISACIAGARKAVGDDGKTQAVIRTVARRGLMLVVTVTVDEKEPEQGPSFNGWENTQRIRYASSIDGNRIAYAITGSGPAVARFTPNMINDLEVEWNIPTKRRMTDAISRQNLLIRSDTLGSGQSDRRVAELDFARQADQMCAVLDAANVDRAAVLSESGGVLPAINMAARHPDRVAKLIIMGGYVDGPERRTTSRAVDPIRTSIDAGWDKSQRGFLMGWMSSYCPEGPLDDLRAITEMARNATSKETMLAIRDRINAASVAPLLPKVQCPTLILHARHDAGHPLDEAQKLAAGIRNAELAVFDTANHLPLAGHPLWDQYVSVVTEFLAH